MAERRADARLNGERMVGVDAGGAIAIALGIAGVPTQLWADLLTGMDGRPGSITQLNVTRLSDAPTPPAMQIELRVDQPGDVRDALEWLVTAIELVNITHDAHERHLAEVYEQAIGVVNHWFDNDARTHRAYRDPTLN